MSSDNGIYVTAFADGWRVREASAIDNLWNFEGKLDRQIALDIYKGAPVFASKSEALRQAELIQKATPHTEYGICVVEAFEHEDFPNG